MIELRKARGLDDNGNFAMPLRWFNQLVVRSGLKFQPMKWFGMSAGAGLVPGSPIGNSSGGCGPPSALRLSCLRWHRSLA